MSCQTDGITVHVRYKDTEITYAGSSEEVWLSLHKFFNRLIPTFDVAQKLLLKTDLQQLAKDCADIIAFSKEGPNLLAPRNKLTDNETLALWLLANHIGSQLGMIQDAAFSKDELQAKLGKNPKIASTRLGELVKSQIIVKSGDEEYEITDFGVFQMQKDVLPKIKAKLGLASS